MNENKIQAVREYLSSKFPESKIEEKYDFDRSAQKFKIYKERSLLLLKISENFLDDNDKEQIKNTLENQKIAELLEENNEKIVFVTNKQPAILDRN